MPHTGVEMQEGKPRRRDTTDVKVGIEQVIMQEGKPRRGFISIAPRQPQAHVGWSSSLSTFLPRRGCINLRQISQGDGTSTTFKYIPHTPPPHVRRGRTWGYRGATSATWQTTLRNLSFACVFPLRRGKLRCVIYHLLVSFLCDVENSAR